MKNTTNGTDNNNDANDAKERQREHGRRGGLASQASGRGHRFDADQAKTAGAKGGAKVSANREHMREIGRRGAAATAKRRARLASEHVIGTGADRKAPQPGDRVGEAILAGIHRLVTPALVHCVDNFNASMTSALCGEYINTNRDSFTTTMYGKTPERALPDTTCETCRAKLVEEIEDRAAPKDHVIVIALDDGFRFVSENDNRDVQGNAYTHDLAQAKRFTKRQATIVGAALATSAPVSAASLRDAIATTRASSSAAKAKVEENREHMRRIGRAAITSTGPTPDAVIESMREKVAESEARIAAAEPGAKNLAALRAVLTMRQKALRAALDAKPEGSTLVAPLDDRAGIAP